MHYVVNNYDIPGLDFPGEGGRELLMENLDFMLRFWKRRAVLVSLATRIASDQQHQLYF